MKFFRISVLLSVVFLNFASINVVSASEEDYFEEFDFEYLTEEIDYSYLRLNEIMPNPEGSDTDYEWVEITNEGTNETNLTNCLIDGKQFVENQVIEGGGYLVIVKDLFDKDLDGQSFEERYGDGSGVWGDSEMEDFQVVEMSISMKNSDDSILFECPGFEDLFEWEDSISGQSFSIDEDGEWTDEYLVTPGRANESAPEIVYPHTIQISEVYPSPLENENEWVELFNFGGEDVNLDGWYLEDGSKRQRLEDFQPKADPPMAEKILRSGSHIALEDELSITLNNSGELLTLYDPNEEEVDSFEYENTEKGLSNIRKFETKKYGDEIFQSQVSTKGEQNKYVDPADIFYGKELLDIKACRKEELKDEVYTSGIITVEMNILGSKIFYIQDATGGIQVYLYDETFGKGYTIGDKIEIIGELKESSGESRIYITEESGIRKIGDEKVETIQLKTGNIKENSEGQLVFISGKIVETSGSSFYVDDGSGKVKVLVKSSTGIDTPSKKKGQYAGVVGIVSQYGDEENSYRILPRYATDIVISNEPVSYGQVLATTGQETQGAGLLGLALILTVLMFRIGAKLCSSN